VPSDVDIEELFSLADEHSVEPLIYASVQRLGGEAVPLAMRQRLQQNVRETARFNLLFRAELANVLRVLENAGIDVRVFKGPVLAEALYGSIAMRSFSDLDLLIHRQDFLRAKTVLEDIGYSLVSTPHWNSDSAIFRAPGCQVTFENSLGVSLDVHWRLLPHVWEENFETEEVWPRRVEASVSGLPVWTLPREPMLLFQCAHGARHLWARLGWICDVARLIQLEEAMDWATVFALADRTEMSRALTVGLALAVNLLGEGAPPMAMERVESDIASQKRAASIEARSTDATSIVPGPLEQALSDVRMCDRTHQRVQRVFEVLFEPTEAEFRVVRLPPALFFVYYAFRPLRLCARYLGQILAYPFRGTR